MNNRQRDRFRGVATVMLAAALLWPVAAGGHPAVQVVDWIWRHLGGRETYEKCRYVEFTWTYQQDGDVKAARSHTWDRYEGDYVLHFTDSKSSDEFKVYFNVHSKKGVAVKNGEAVGEEENTRLVERAYATFINDTYWLLLPTKLHDPGARVQFVGHASKTGDRDIEAVDPEGPRMVEMGNRTEENHHHHGEDTHDDTQHADEPLVVLHLWFYKEVGLTPRDEYWIYVNHDGAIAGWRYVLEDGNEGEWEWTEEKDCGMGITLPTKRISADGRTTISFPRVQFREAMDRSVFRASPRN